MEDRSSIFKMMLKETFFASALTPQTDVQLSTDVMHLDSPADELHSGNGHVKDS